ncbi:seipin-like isoform X2 [Macrobrachium nipponense]|uniref:seipin-like isoform X2 n=1 Tax=Macrobrachium nipponense TaxID=159736 RepID=UPI0030C881F2
MPKLLGSYIEEKRKAAAVRVEEWQGILYSIIVFVATLVVMFWASLFLYTSFYFTYMPQESITWPIHFQYKACSETPGICSNPTSVVSVTDPIRGSILARGQKYRVVVDIEMPESPTNQRLGMFLIDLDMKSQNGESLRHSSRSAMLRYRSPLLQTIGTTIFAPLMLYGVSEEKQMVTVELFAQYEEDPLNPLSEVQIELHTRHVELYAAQLRIHAVFTGLRYFMYHYPLSAATVGVGICMVFLSAVVILSWYQFSGSSPAAQVGKPTFPNGQALTGPSEDLRSINNLTPERKSSHRHSFSMKKGQESDKGVSDSIDVYGTKDLNNSDLEKSEDSNLLPESERRDSDEFEVVSPTKFDNDVNKRSRRSSEVDEDETYVRHRVQSISKMPNESLLDE